MSSENEHTGIWRIVSIPPRIFDWVLDHKLLTFLAVGAVCWGWGEIKDIMKQRAREQRVIEEQKKAEEQAIFQAEQRKKQLAEIKKSESITFRNMPSGHDPHVLTPEEVKRAEKETAEARLAEKAVRDTMKYTFLAKPKIQPLPVATNRLDRGAKR